MGTRKVIAITAVLVGLVLVIYSCQKKTLTTTSRTYQIKPYEPKEFPNLKNLSGFSQEAIALHLALYKGYVKKTNELILKMKEMLDSGKVNTPEFAEIRRRFGFEFDGMRLHELYFESLGGEGELKPESDLYKAIVANFGSFDAWKKDFIATAMMRGSGWVILYYDPLTGRLMNTWIDEHQKGHLAGCRIILPLDVFEHAYLIDFRLDKRAYIEGFFKNLNWDVALSRFEGARMQKEMPPHKTLGSKAATLQPKKTKEQSKVAEKKTHY